MSTPNLAAACTTLRAGGVIAYPTEAVWGLGCDPANSTAVARVLDLKQRPVRKGLILVAADMLQIEALLLPLSQDLRAKLQASWPGPITWLIPDPNAIYSTWVRGEHGSVAVRVSAHPLVQRLCAAFGSPIVSTSANITGAPAIQNKAELKAAFADKIDCIVDGELGAASAVSEIRDLLTGNVLR